MEPKQQPGSPAMRVSIVSVSRNQREHLKRLIEQHGPRVVGMSGFRDYDLTRDGQYPDVLLVDLDQADDASLTRIERLLDQSNVPVLFNESTAVPITPGTYRDDWVDNLVGKLYNLATHRSLLAKAPLSSRPRYAQTADHALPNVLIVAHSKTRRRVLQIILAAQGIQDSTEISFDADFIAERIEHYDALLVDEHNVSPEEQIVLAKLTSQTQVPVQLCNSSTIPYSAVERRTWGIQLAGKIIKISKFQSSIPAPVVTTQVLANRPTHTPISHFIAINGEHEWGNRLSEVLAQVRTSLTHQAATAKVRRSSTPKTPNPVTSAPGGSVPTTTTTNESAHPAAIKERSSVTPATSTTQNNTRQAKSKLNITAATSGVIAAPREIKNTPTPAPRLNPKNRPADHVATAAKQVPNRSGVKPTDPAYRSRVETPSRVKTVSSSHDIIDATNLSKSLPNSSKAPEPLLADARDTEIERFFDFDKELDISQQRHPLGEGHVLNSVAHDDVLPWNLEEESTNPFSKHTANLKASGSTQKKKTPKKQRSRWLDGIRKLFH